MDLAARGHGGGDHSAYKAVTSVAVQARLSSEIEGLLAKHQTDLNETFEAMFRPEVEAAAFSGSVRAFLQEINGVLRQPDHQTSFPTCLAVGDHLRLNTGPRWQHPARTRLRKEERT
jgi:hypothetical protein